jgi:hypothetical protein
MDNATAEYAFVTSFFSNETPGPRPDPISPARPAAQSVVSPTGSSLFGMHSPSGSDSGHQQPQPLPSALTTATPGLGGFMTFVAKSKEDQAAIGTIWKQVMDPVMDYCTVRLQVLFIRSFP